MVQLVPALPLLRRHPVELVARHQAHRAEAHARVERQLIDGSVDLRRRQWHAFSTCA
jgi:hypothetical protein